MKWIGKEVLFKIPVIGWMMHLSADIQVDRASARSGAVALITAQKVLAQKCSVMIFPEGTRTLDGRVRAFANGAFHLAIRARVPIIPVALDGTFDCIPKNSWKFGKPSDIFLKVLPPIDTSGYTVERVAELRDLVRTKIMEQVAQWRGVPLDQVDGTATGAPA
jgi:1-acyl-sn-glycerol-3-phosphate acyltransferase